MKIIDFFLKGFHKAELQEMQPELDRKKLEWQKKMLNDLAAINKQAN